MCVCDLAEVLELTNSAVSQHLQMLKNNNILKTRHAGQTIYHSLAQNIFTSNLQDMFALGEISEPHLFMQKETSS